jgi:uncharacterized membrane protein
MEGSAALATVFWHIGGLVCHQLADRSPQFDGTVFPLCFRCAGLYLSLPVAFAWLGVTGGVRRRLPELRCAVGISMLTVPLMVDGLANAIGLWSSTGPLRALTGAGVGLVLPLLLVPLAQREIPVAALAERPTPAAPLARRPTPATAPDLQASLKSPLWILPPAVVCVALLWLLVHPMQRWVFQGLATAASAAPLVFWFTFLLAGWRILFGSGRPVRCTRRRRRTSGGYQLSAIDGAHLH